MRNAKDNDAQFCNHDTCSDMLTTVHFMTPLHSALYRLLIIVMAMGISLSSGCQSDNAIQRESTKVRVSSYVFASILWNTPFNEVGLKLQHMGYTRHKDELFTTSMNDTVILKIIPQYDEAFRLLAITLSVTTSSRYRVCVGGHLVDFDRSSFPRNDAYGQAELRYERQLLQQLSAKYGAPVALPRKRSENVLIWPRAADGSCLSASCDELDSLAVYAITYERGCTDVGTSSADL